MYVVVNCSGHAIQIPQEAQTDELGHIVATLFVSEVLEVHTIRASHGGAPVLQVFLACVVPSRWRRLFFLL